MSDAGGATPVRDEDAFDVAAMAGWLRTHAAEGYRDSRLDGIPEVLQFGGGASNLTYLLRYADTDLILRRPPTGTKARGAHDMGREFGIQSALAPVYPYVADMVALCTDDSVIGGDFYVMERLEGTILRRDVPEGLGLDRAGVRALGEAAVDRLVDLHAVDVTAAGLEGLHRGEGYVGRQVGGWSERYRKARTPDVPDLEDVMTWLAAHQPSDSGTCIIHNDWRLDNLVLAPGEPTRVVGVLDWELATVGDPLMDLASALAYWVQADDDPGMVQIRLQPTHTPGMPTRAEVVERYLAATGRTLPDSGWAFYEVFGLFRLAAIGQQIYYRFFHAQTTNPAYGRMQPLVAYLGGRCRALLG